MNKNIEIQYKHIPYEIIADFEKCISNSSITISILEDKEEYLNATGGTADILIYIDTHLFDLIVGGFSGLLVNAVYDSIKGIWNKVSTFYSKKGNDLQEDKNYISLNFKINADKSLEYNLAGNVDEKSIDKLTKNLFEYLKDTKRQEKDFKNPDYKNRNDLSTKITFQNNPKTNEWEPINYADFEKWRDEQIRRVSDEYNS